MNDLDEWIDCWKCGGEAWHHDCGEDVCCCADPEPNVMCDICLGYGGWYKRGIGTVEADLGPPAMAPASGPDEV